MALSFNFPLLRRLFLLGAVLMLASGALKGAAMTSETINLLYDYYKAAGSRLQMEKVNTLKVSGKVIAFVKDQEGKEQEVNQEFELWLAKPFLVRFNIRNEGSELSRGWDGYYSWIMMPTPDGGRVVQEAPRETHEGLLYLAGLFDNFYSLELKGYAFSKGKDESFDGKTYTMLRFTQDKQGLKGCYLLGKEMLPIVAKVYPFFGDKDHEGLAQMSDWRDVEGVKYPFLVSYEEDGAKQFTLKVEKVRPNIAAPALYFVMPEKEVDWIAREKDRKKAEGAAAQR